MMRVMGLVVITLMSCSSNQKATLPPEKKLVTPKITPLKAVETNNHIRLTGQVSSMNRAVLLFQTPGTIKHIYKRVGMFVKKDEVLAELDSRNQAYQAEMAKFQYEQALNQKAMVERNFNIDKQLREKQLSAQLQFENSKMQFENISLAADMARTNYKIAAKALDDTKLRAPYDCVVTRQIKFVGESTSTMLPPDGPSVFEIYDAQTPELILQAPESLLGKIKIGDDVEVSLPALGIKVAAKIVRYVPVISDSTRTFVIVAHLNKADKRVVPGYFIEGTLKL